MSPRGLTTGPRLLKFRATRGQIYNAHIFIGLYFYIPHILNLNLLTQINLFTWILGSRQHPTKTNIFVGTPHPG